MGGCEPLGCKVVEGVVVEPLRVLRVLRSLWSMCLCPCGG